MIQFTPIVATLVAPPRTIADHLKDEAYHLAHGTENASKVDATKINWYRNNYEVNRRMYAGDQWFRPNEQTFLKDENNGELNRIQIVANMVRPVVEQYRGNAERLVISASVTSRTKRSKTRKELTMQRTILMGRIARTGPAMAEAIGRQGIPVGADDQQSRALADSMYQDRFISAATDLLTAVATLNDFEQQRREEAMHLALSGACFSETYIHGHHQRFRVTHPDEVVFDTDCKNIDFSDAKQWTVQKYTPFTIICERHSISEENKEALEKALKSQVSTDGMGNGSLVGAGCLVTTTYWRDLTRAEKAYVKDENGQPKLVRINYVAPGETEPRYKDKDIIPPPDNAYAKKYFGTKDKLVGDAEVIRYCTYISQSNVPLVLPGSGDKKYDMVLDYGQDILQEVDPDETANVEFPMSGAAYAMLDGLIISPVNDLISPQLFKNRVMSVIEALVSQSGGTGAVFDASFIDPKMPLETLQRRRKNGQDIQLNSRGKGLPNVFGNYDDTPKAGVYAMAELLQMCDRIGQASTGVHEPMTGDPSGSNQLVRTTQMLIQRGSIMQEPYYAALALKTMQKYRSIISAGKTFYSMFPSKLEEVIGDEHAITIIASKAFLCEQLRCTVKRDNSEQQRIDQANELLTFFMSNQLISQSQFAELYNNAYVHDVTMALQQHAKDKEQMAKQMQQSQQAQAQSQAAALKEADLQRQTEDLHNQMVQEVGKEADGMRQRDALYARENAKAVFAVPKKEAATV